MRNPDLSIFWIGQNGSYESAEELISQIESCIEFSGNKNYIVIGFHTEARRYLNEYLQKRFKSRFIDFLTYSQKYGLDRFGITPTDHDIQDIENNLCPSSLRSDHTHLNQYGYQLLGEIVYQRIMELGYLEN